MHHKFVMVKCLNCRHVSMTDENVQNIGRKGNIN